jgi:hypothetical protein
MKLKKPKIKKETAFRVIMIIATIGLLLTTFLPILLYAL